MWEAVEKYKGYSLVAQEGWVTLIHDTTGMQVAGPYDTEQDVRNFVRVFYPRLQEGIWSLGR